MEPGLYGGVAEPQMPMLDENWEAGSQGSGPGFQRMRAGSASRSRAPASTERPTSTGLIAAGIRVFHQKFGYGTVQSNDGGKLEIEFEKAGRKKVMESFVEPA